ncbi:hypothetical protein ORD22_13665 [Sporosarcina sp. GW1-11]|uniref:hypothetical protein n=1 Tax=Sporosarcina sp. GW1-11 TaxID=2899126 RepID=UPI00294BB58C|nr:hypothetical protein [Sporosarcina sp. GW1-11]MDV6379263.1 hypothetical protein [Sporosarcina sp. GW1-11]
MVGAIKLSVAGVVLFLFCIALRKDIKNLTEEKRKRPFVFILELLPIIGLVTFIVGWVIFRNVPVGGIAIILCLIGFSSNTIRQWKANRARENIKAVILLLLIAIVFIAFIQ